MIEVSAGIIRREDGKMLICQRGEGRANAHLWEFPGGKREQGEDAARCLSRELQEELGLQVTDIRSVCENDWQGIHFTFLSCVALNEPVPTEHEAVKFVSPRQLLEYSFCPADQMVARSLALCGRQFSVFFWDFDGTLADTYPALTAMLQETCRLHGFTVEADRALNLLKVELRHAVDTLAAEQGIDAEEMMQTFRRLERDTPATVFPPIPGVLEAIHALKGKHYLVTHRDVGAVDWLKVNGLSFADYVTREKALPRKPAPDMITYLLKKHGLDAADCVMIGDRPLDMEAGQAAGVTTCLLDTEERFSQTPATFRTADAGQLPQILCPLTLFV